MPAPGARLRATTILKIIALVLGTCCRGRCSGLVSSGNLCWAPGGDNAECLCSEDNGSDGAAAAAAAAEVPAAARLDKWEVRVGETLRVVGDATVVERATRAGQAAGVEWSDDLRRLCGKRGAAVGRAYSAGCVAARVHFSGSCL